MTVEEFQAVGIVLRVVHVHRGTANRRSLGGSFGAFPSSLKIYPVGELALAPLRLALALALADEVVVVVRREVVEVVHKATLIG